MKKNLKQPNGSEGFSPAELQRGNKRWGQFIKLEKPGEPLLMIFGWPYLRNKFNSKQLEAVTAIDPRSYFGKGIAPIGA